MMTNHKTENFQEGGQRPVEEQHHPRERSGCSTPSRPTGLTFYAELVTQTLIRIENRLHGQVELEHSPKLKNADLQLPGC